MSHETIRAKLARIYGEDRADDIADDLSALAKSVQIHPPDDAALSESDAILITYGDQVRQSGEPPLQTLHTFLKDTLKGTFNSVHILPFYPYSSDDGFSVIDYTAVDPNLGDWDDVEALSGDFKLMFDAVFNHISAESAWFKAFLRQEDPYDDFFVVIPPGTDLSAVVRPRALPLLTKFDTAKGEKQVWTTFSEDQIDLNFANPRVLIETMRILLFYVEKGAQLIRLDAIAFLWKVPGTSSIHLEETHLLIQVMRDVLDMVAPHVVLITETNVPHEENISYFGDGTNEAQMVYNFALPPLILHTLRTGDASKLSKWAESLERVGERTTYFNFTASHDGVGMRPATGILSQSEIDALVDMAKAHGGRVSYRSQSDGSQTPYELNITYFDAITDPQITAETPDVAVSRFMVSQAIALALIGVPGIYFHSVFGSRNDQQGVERTGHNRSINREKLDVEPLRVALDKPDSLRAQVYTAYHKLLRIRTDQAAFHPFGEQTVMRLSPGVFALKRVSPDGRQRIIALHNVSGETFMLDVPVDNADVWVDLISEEQYTVMQGTIQVVLEAYQVAWLKAQ